MNKLGQNTRNISEIVNIPDNARENSNITPGDATPSAMINGRLSKQMDLCMNELLKKFDVFEVN